MLGIKPSRYSLEGGFMNTNEIVLAIDAEISRLQQVKALLTDTSSVGQVKRKPGRTTATTVGGKATSFKPADFDVKPRKRRTLSPEARARIAAAQKVRWAKVKSKS
jgi:hypothetical protein